MPEAAVEAQARYAGRDRKIVAILLAVGALMLVIAVATATRTMISISRDTEAVQHTLEVETTISQLSALGERVETARRGYLIQPDRSFGTIVRDSTADFNATLATLARLVDDNPKQLRRVERIARLAAQKESLVMQMLASPAAFREAVRDSDFDSEGGVRITREMRTVLDAMVEAEKSLLAQRNRNQLDSLIALYLTGGLSLALLLAVMLGVIALVMRFNRDLTSAQSRLRSVNEGLEDAVAARTTDLTRANAEIQRFAYIVSHDLRSPLVNVLGFTAELDEARRTLHRFLSTLIEENPELRDQAAWLAVEEDLPEALDFIRGSTEKMDRLINSILELSRQGRRALKAKRLDMTELARNVADTMTQRAEQADATVKVGTLPELENDRIAVEQILSNLIENALKYLNPSRPGIVTVEGRQNGKWVEIVVSDNGRGIAPEDHERIFDLFRRAGTQDQPGEGIGLANVRALAYRLGGRITVESELDKGAQFTVILPEKFTLAEPA